VIKERLQTVSLNAHIQTVSLNARLLSLNAKIQIVQALMHGYKFNSHKLLEELKLVVKRKAETETFPKPKPGSVQLGDGARVCARARG
jgi:hypothetical protein